VKHLTQLVHDSSMHMMVSYDLPAFLQASTVTYVQLSAWQPDFPDFCKLALAQPAGDPVAAVAVIPHNVVEVQQWHPVTPAQLLAATVGSPCTAMSRLQRYARLLLLLPCTRVAKQLTGASSQALQSLLFIILRQIVQTACWMELCTVNSSRTAPDMLCQGKASESELIYDVWDVLLPRKATQLNRTTAAAVLSTVVSGMKGQ
jgi:hypothetical protein